MITNFLFNLILSSHRDLMSQYRRLLTQILALGGEHDLVDGLKSKLITFLLLKEFT